MQKKIIYKIENDISSGNAKQAGINLWEEERQGPYNNIFISNMGNIVEFETPINISLDNLTVWNEMDLSSESSLSTLSAYENMVFIYTFNNRLRINFFFNEYTAKFDLKRRLISGVINYVLI